MNPTTFTYSRIYFGYYNLLSELVTPSTVLHTGFKGTKVIVETLKVDRIKLKRKSELIILAFVYDPTLSSLFSEKQNKGYQTLYDYELKMVYPEFESDLEKTTMWALLKL